MLVSDLLATLVRKKLATKAPNPADARSRLLRPTARGVKITNAGVRTIEAFDARFFGRVGDVKRLHRALITLVDAPM